LANVEHFNNCFTIVFATELRKKLELYVPSRIPTSQSSAATDLRGGDNL